MEGLSYTFILCYYANSSTNSMAKFSNVVYKSNWYCQKPRIQKLLKLMISRAQKPNIFMGLKIIDCSLESFTKVDFDLFAEIIDKIALFSYFQLNKTAATYYIMFRNISAR